MTCIHNTFHNCSNTIDYTVNVPQWSTCPWSNYEMSSDNERPSSLIVSYWGYCSYWRHWGLTTAIAPSGILTVVILLVASTHYNQQEGLFHFLQNIKNERFGAAWWAICGVWVIRWLITASGFTLLVCDSLIVCGSMCMPWIMYMVYPFLYFVVVWISILFFISLFKTYWLHISIFVTTILFHITIPQ